MNPVDRSDGAATIPVRPSRGGLAYWSGIVLLALLLTLLAIHAVSVCIGFVDAVRSPFEIDYGEGIVWQQAALIPGPNAYSTNQALPFIVFHYPPVYHLLARVASWFMPTMLEAGRLVSSVASLVVAVLVGSLVVAATPRPDPAMPSPGGGVRSRGLPIAIAVAMGLLALSLHVVRTWGMLMRVDMVATAFGLAGVLVASRADGRFVGTLCGLLLCLCAVYTKQTALPAGVAVCVMAVIRRPRPALAAAALTLLIGLVVLGVLDWRTDGGFLQNIILANINRYDIRHAYWVFVPEWTSWLFMPLIVYAAFRTLLGLWRLRAPGPRLRAVGQGLLMLRLIDRPRATRATVLLCFALSTLMLFTVFKSGGGFNYLLDWLCVGCVLLGVLMCDLLATRRTFVAVTAAVLVGVLIEPLRLFPAPPTAARLAEHDRLVQMIAAAKKPVASENMTLLMQAGKPVIFEPSIVTELASVGRWDERPLVRMILDHGFAFMITTDNTSRATPAVLAAMHAAYPRVEEVRPNLFLNLPATPDQAAPASASPPP